jgi:hypothetical protein
MSEESKRKLSESMKGKNIGKKRTEEQKLIMSTTLKGRKRNPLSQETKQKLRLANLGKNSGPRSEEHRKAISSALKGKPKSAEQVEKQRQSLLKFYENKRTVI